MGDHPFRFTAIALGAFALLAVPAFATSGPAADDFAGREIALAQQTAQARQKKVWTNADLDRLREQDAISIVGLGPDEFDVVEPQPSAQGAKQRVWTNMDLDRLREQGGISIVPAEAQTATPTAAPAGAPAAAAPAGPPAIGTSASSAYYDRFQDPYWYQSMSVRLHYELAAREAALYQYERNVALAHDAVTQPGVGFSQGDEGITLESGVQHLQLKVEDVLIELQRLEDLARRNGILPGVLRG